jgi:hypothetical protein
MSKEKKGVHMAHCNQGEYKGSCKYGDKGCPALKMTAVQLSYTNAVCPDCGEPIPKYTKDGDSCFNCGHVFYEIRELKNDLKIKKVTMITYIKEEMRGLKRFREFWVEERKKTPKNFPLTMGLGEWDEQFRMFDQ